MNTIDNIAFKDYGMYITTGTGLIDLPEAKEQFFTIYGNEGFEITKRKGNELFLNGFLIASNIADFLTKTSDLYTLFSAVGTRSIVLTGSAINCFCIKGFKVTNVFVVDKVFAKINIKLTVV